MTEEKEMEKKSSINVPEEVKGWNWGAFFLHFIWGIGNRTYIGFLGMVPFLNIFMMPILGFKGNEWAWKNGEWESIEHFKAVQKKWNIAGLLATGVYLFLFIKGFYDILFG
jgi:hypothetical protein